MLIDWLSLRLDRDSFPDWVGWDSLSSWGDRILRYCPSTGETRWEVSAWDSLRSDSHQLAVKASAASLWIQGSPARVMGDGDTVFGAGDDGRSIVSCAIAMIDFASKLLGLESIPSYEGWSVTRIDVTFNYFLGSLANVRVALAELRGVEGGRYRVSQQAGDTVYWSHRSRHRSGKAYAKGPHLRYLLSQKTYTGRRYSEVELKLADSLLRLELRLGSKFFHVLPSRWYDLTWGDLKRYHDDYFLRMVGIEGVQGVDMNFVERFVAAAPTPGQGKAAARSWALVQAMGWQAAKDSMPARTWYRHHQIWRSAGLGDLDVSAGRLVNLRRPVVMHPVSSWAELRRLA